MHQPLPHKPLTLADVEAAAGVLGFRGNVTELFSAELVKAAYREKLREHHPDTGGPVMAAPDRIAMLKQAKDVLLRWIAERPDPGCTLCRGTKVIPSGAFGTRPCPKCN